MTSTKPILIANGITRCRKDGSGSFTLQVNNIHLHKGEILAITGPSGTGKSTLLELIGMTLSPDAATTFKIGDGHSEPHNVHSLWKRNDLNRITTIRAQHMGYLLQDGALLPFLKVEQNITLPLTLLRKNKDPELMKDLTQRLGIDHLLNRYPETLSTGERQRVALARAIIHRPALLLADEPTAALDPDNANIVFDMLLDLVQQQGIAAIVVSHDINRVRHYKLPEISPIKLPQTQGAGSIFDGEVKT